MPRCLQAHTGSCQFLCQHIRIPHGRQCFEFGPTGSLMRSGLLLCQPP